MAKGWGPGNPLWEWKRKHGKLKTRARRKHAARRSRSRGVVMARYRKHGHKKGNQLMRLAKRGMMPIMGGVLGALLTGALVGYAQKKGMVPNVGFGVIPAEIEPHVVPLVAGGLPGVLAAAIVKGGIGEGASTGTASGY